MTQRAVENRELALDRRTVLSGMLSAGGLLAGCAGAAPESEPKDRAYPPIGSFVEVGGLQLHYWERGTGPAVVLVHGANGNLRDWTFAIAPMLAEHFRVVAFDRPGFGYSDRPRAGGWDPSMQAEILRAAARSLDVDRPVVVGHSWGGALAMAWALDAPDTTAGVVAVSAVTLPYRIAEVVRFLALDGLFIDIYQAYLLSEARRGRMRDFIARAFNPQEIPPGYVDYVGAPLALRPKTMRANGEDLQHIHEALPRMKGSYHTVSVPLEIIHGSADFVDWEHHARGLAELVPHARLTLLPDVGHMAHHAAPDLLLDAIGRLTKMG